MHSQFERFKLKPCDLFWLTAMFGGVSPEGVRAWNVIEEYTSGGAQVASMAYGAATDEPVFRWTSGYDLAYYHQDALGNVTTLSDTSGIPVETYRYDVFGQPSLYDPYHLPRSASFFGNPLLFTAREYLPQASLYQYRHRSFSVGDPNLLRHVGNSPTNAVDPWGLDRLPLSAKQMQRVQGSIGRIQQTSPQFAKDIQNLLDSGKIMYDDEFWKTGDLAYTPKFIDSKIYLGDIFSSIGYPDTQFDDILMEECIHQSQFHSNLASKIGYLYYDIVTAIWTSPGAIPGGYYENSPSENVAKTLVNQIQTKAGR